MSRQATPLFPRPSDEAGRLRALGRYGRALQWQRLTAGLPELERVARLAMRLCNSEAAFVALVNEDGVHTLARCNVETAQWSRAGAFCSWTICEEEYEGGTFEVNDTWQDDRFSQSRILSNGEAVRFYAGVPLRATGGYCLGTLAVVGSKPHELSDDERQMLCELGVLCSDEIELRWQRLRFGIEQNEHAELERALTIARQENWLLQTAINSSEAGVVITDPNRMDNPIVFANPAFQQITGYSQEEVLGHNCRFLQGTSTSAADLDAIREGLRKHEPVQVTLLNYRRDGSTFWNELTINPVHDESEQLIAFVGVQLDVSARVEAEEALKRANDELEVHVAERTQELQWANDALRREVEGHLKVRDELSTSREELRALAAHLDCVQEEERTRISREIHDELGQLLTHLKMELVLVQNSLSDRSETGGQTEDECAAIARKQEEERGRIEGMTVQLDAALQSVRRIASDLRPSVLDRFGLCEAIRYLATEFSRHAGIRCSFKNSDFDENIIGTERGTALFRITQEALTNVARHANATRVDITLNKRGDYLILDIRDNGHGVPEGQYAGGTSPCSEGERRSLGLLGVQERVALLQGQVCIGAARPKARVNRGMRLEVKLPLERRRKG